MKEAITVRSRALTVTQEFALSSASFSVELLSSRPEGSLSAAMWENPRTQGILESRQKSMGTSQVFVLASSHWGPIS